MFRRLEARLRGIEYLTETETGQATFDHYVGAGSTDIYIYKIHATSYLTFTDRDWEFIKRKTQVRR